MTSRMCKVMKQFGLWKGAYPYGQSRADCFSTWTCMVTPPNVVVFFMPTEWQALAKGGILDMPVFFRWIHLTLTWSSVNLGMILRRSFGRVLENMAPAGLRYIATVSFAMHTPWSAITTRAECHDPLCLQRVWVEQILLPHKSLERTPHTCSRCSICCYAVELFCLASAFTFMRIENAAILDSRSGRRMSVAP